MVGAIRRSSGGPNVNHHQSRNIAAMGIETRIMDAVRGTRPRIWAKDCSDIKSDVTKSVLGCQPDAGEWLLGDGKWGRGKGQGNPSKAQFPMLNSHPRGTGTT